MHRLLMNPDCTPKLDGSGLLYWSKSLRTLPRPSSRLERGHPSPKHTPLSPFGASILAPSAFRSSWIKYNERSSLCSEIGISELNKSSFVCRNIGRDVTPSAYFEGVMTPNSMIYASVKLLDFVLLELPQTMFHIVQLHSVSS